MKIPHAIQAYFDADRKNDCEAVLDCFATGATVHDEGRSHAGHHAIGGWWEYSKARYQHVAEPVEALADGPKTRVIAEVRGQFPGSPARLTYTFSLAGEKIEAPEIGA